MANGGQKDVRELMGSLLKLHIQASLQNRELDEDFLSQQGTNPHEGRRENVSLDDIIALMEHNLNINRTEMQSKSRKSDVNWARQVAMYLARRYTLLSLQEIGKTFGRDHATVSHAFDKVKQAMETKPAARFAVEFLTKKLEARSPGGLDAL